MGNRGKISSKNKLEKQLAVVGIGASAGGLEALQLFFKNLPENIGAAYVVVQHLSPDYKSMMDELLARYTKMPIKVIKDSMILAPNTVYLIPPRQNLEIYNDQLFLNKLTPGKGLNLPIDIFFRSLAEDKGKDAIGIILSGTGSDGTMGTRAIKESDGMIMVQDKETAKFNGMPTSAINTGLADYILPPEKMGYELENFLKHPLVRKKTKNSFSPAEEADSFTKVLLILKTKTGTDFSMYKENTILRRLERRISINRFQTLDDYIPFIKESDKEKEILYREFLIGVTSFFRDKEAFDSLRDNVLPKLLTNDKKQIRVWTTGCSTGEEAYSIAILILEAATTHKFTGEIKIFASDIDRRAIETAGYGFYPDSIIADMEIPILTKYFTRNGDGYLINKDVRNLIVFAPHNLLKDPPFSKIDLVVCRNLFIYFKPEIQTSVLHRFYYSINPGGFLFMGSSETLGGMSEAFDIVDQKNKIYRYKAGFKTPAIDNLMLDSKKNKYVLTENLSERTKKSQLNADNLLNKVITDFIPPSIIIDSNYYVISIINNINPFTEIQPGNYSNELFSILPKEFGLFVNNLLRQLKAGHNNHISRIISGLDSMDRQTIKVDGRKIMQNEQSFFMLTFEIIEEQNEQTAKQVTENFKFSPELDSRLIELEKELKSAKENLAATIEELESANEELQSSNEELVASNEELQSTNEELQSVNEELYTVNSEHQQKIEELTQLNNDISNLLKNTEVAAIYLDNKMCIRKITPYANIITNVRESDVGRPLSHLSIMDKYPELADDVNKVLDNLQPLDKEIPDKNGKKYFSRIRPYRTENNAVDGVLVTIIDITELDKLKSKARIIDERLASSLDFAKMAWWEWNVASGDIIYNDRKSTMLGYSSAEFPRQIEEVFKFIHPDDYEITMNEIRQVLEGKKAQWNTKYRMKRKDGSYMWFQDQGVAKSKGPDGKPKLLFGVVIDISEFQTMEEDLNKNTRLLSLIMKNTPVATIMVDANGWITYANARAEELFNISSKQITSRNYDASEWEITGTDGEPLKNGDLPFSIIKKTKKPLYNFRHFIKIPPKKSILLTIDGTPVLSKTGLFEGAVFTIKVG